MLGDTLTSGQIVSINFDKKPEKEDKLKKINSKARHT